MRQIINGREVEVPTKADGTIDSEALKTVAGIPADRPLVLMRPDGSNHLINPGQKVVVNPGQYFSDLPRHTRGRGQQ